MLKSSVLDALFPAIRQQILAATLLEPEKWWYLTELASHLGTSPSSLQRELGALTRSGLLEHRQDGRRTYCDNFRRSTTRAEWWAKKIEANKARDCRVQQELRELGWRVVIVWECQLQRPGILDDLSCWIKTAYVKGPSPDITYFR